jgi:hypothetical protein
MTDTNSQNYDSVQKLVNSCNRRIGLTRMTKNTVSEGPDALMEKAFNYLITAYVDAFTIYNSLDSAFRMADMVISDPINWRAVAPLTGHEVISIAYKNGLSASDAKEKIIHFRVHNIIEETTDPAAQAGFNRIVVKLVEFPAFQMLTSNQIYKTYPIDENNTPNLRLSQIVKDTLDNIKYFSLWYDVDIEDSVKDSIHFFVPNWIPLKVMNFCKKYAISEKKSYPMYVFHIDNDPKQDKPIAHFKPVFSFIDDVTKYRAYGSSYEDTNKESINDNQKVVYSPADVISKSSFDYFDAQRTSTFSGDTEVLFDYQDDNEYIATDYDAYLNSKYKGISPYVAYPISYGNQWSSFYRSAWNKVEGEKLISNELYNEYASNILLGGLRCKSMAAIYEGRSPGERAELIFSVVNTDMKFDEMMSGAWLTWEVNDHFIGGRAFSSITFISDSFVNINDTTNTFKKINTITDNLEPDTINQG